MRCRRLQSSSVTGNPSLWLVQRGDIQVCGWCRGGISKSVVGAEGAIRVCGWCRGGDLSLWLVQREGIRVCGWCRGGWTLTGPLTRGSLAATRRGGRFGLVAMQECSPQRVHQLVPSYLLSPRLEQAPTVHKRKAAPDATQTPPNSYPTHTLFFRVTQKLPNSFQKAAQNYPNATQTFQQRPKEATPHTSSHQKATQNAPAKQPKCCCCSRGAATDFSFMFPDAR
jgi:hypothetical protein